MSLGLPTEGSASADDPLRKVVDFRHLKSFSSSVGLVQKIQSQNNMTNALSTQSQMKKSGKEVRVAAPKTFILGQRPHKASKLNW